LSGNATAKAGAPGLNIPASAIREDLQILAPGFMTSNDVDPYFDAKEGAEGCRKEDQERFQEHMLRT